MKFLVLLFGVIVVFFAYKSSLWIGIGTTALFIGYGIYNFLPSIYRILGQRRFGEGDYKAAEKMYKKAVDTKRGGYKIRMEYAYILLRTGKFEEAEQQVSFILSHKLKPGERNNAVLRRCMCYYKLGNLDEALSDAQQLYDEGYKSIQLYGLLGYFKILKNPTSKETFDFCAEAYDYANDDRDICDNMLICYYNNGEYEKAKEISDKIIEDAPKFVEAWYHAAQIDVKLGKYEDAAKKLEKISECNRSQMTTITEEEVEALKNTVKARLRRI